MATSGTYNFLSPESLELITDAYERVMTLPDPITGQQIETAQRSANLILSAWYNRGWNLWTTGRRLLGLYTGQNAYTLSNQIQDVMWAELRTSNRNLGGTAASSSGGTASFAFDNNTATACIQTSANGNISYQWGTQYAINMVGIQSNINTNYTLLFQSSNDGVTWTTVQSEPVQSYLQGIIVWFNVSAPVVGTYFRVVETGGSTLNVQELYFNNSITDTVVTKISAVEYDSQPQKNQLARPSTFYLDRQTTPVLYLWPTPTSQYKTLYYTTKEAIQDIGQMTNSANIPTRFLEPFTAELAAKLALKLRLKLGIGMDVIQTLKAYADEEFSKAAAQDIENVPLRIYPDRIGGWF